MNDKNLITYVTGYFELPDTGRNFNLYLERASKFTLRIPGPLTIYCEAHNLPLIIAERAKYSNLTNYIVIRKEELELYKYLPQVLLNHKKRPRLHNRITPDYEIITCSKFTMLRDAINNNYFNSKFFCWVDFGLVASDYSNMNTLESVSRDIIQNNRENVRMCFINYNSIANTLNLEHYYGLQGACGIAGTFYSGSKEKLLKFVELCIDCYKRTIRAGFGHADEQIYLQVYFEYILSGANQNDLFDFYFGDYYYIISNYTKFNTPLAKHIILYMLLPNMLNDIMYPPIKELIKYLVKFVIDGYKSNIISLEKHEIIKLFEILF